jgi:tetratricopeptide (TPR) repeat protein
VPIRGGPIRGDLPPRNPRFVGREELLDRVRRLLGNGPVVLLPTPEHQLGGVGRTQLAVEYAHRWASTYELVWWISAEQTAGMRASLVGLAQQLGLPEARDINRTLGAVRDALSRGEPYRNWLVIFENANRPEDIKPYLPSGAGHVLVTSRNPRWTAEVAQSVPIDVFDRADSVDFLRARTPEVSAVEADRLAAHLGDVPMALDQAASVCAATGPGIDDYLARYDALAAELAFPTPIRVSWGLAAAALAEASPAAAELLELCAFLASAPVSWQLVWAARGLDLAPDLARTVRIERRLKAAIRLIGRYGLAELDPPGDRLLVHPLVRGMIAQQLSSERHAAQLRTVRGMLAAADPGDPDNPAHWARYAELTAHLVHADVLGGETEEIRQLVVNCVRHLFASGDYDSSRDLAAQAVSRWRGSLGESDEQTLAASFHLANALRAVGRVTEARTLNAQTLDMQRDVAGEDDEATLATANSVGADLRVQGLFDDARQLDANNLVRHRRLFGESFPTTLRCSNNLAVDLRLLGDFRSARTLDEQTLRHRQAALADGHPETLSSRASLAFDLYGLGDFAGSSALLAGRPDVLGDDHPMMLWAGRFEAMAARRTAAPGARALATANVALFRQKFGDLNVETLGAVMSLANCCRDDGDAAEAHHLLERAYARYHAVLGEEHPFTYAAASNLATVARATGRFAEARTIDAEALGGLRASVGVDHPFTLSCANGYAADLRLTGDDEQSREIAADTLLRSRSVRGADHPDTLALAFNLSLAVPDDDRASVDQASVDLALADLRKAYGEHHPVPVAAAAGVRLETDIELPPL